MPTSSSLNRRAGTFVSLLILVTLSQGSLRAQTSKPDPLLQGFISPPNAARPRVWWHWMNGNITKDGIAKDLAWMHRVGIGGFQNFDASLGTPQIVEKRLIYMTPEWKDAFQFTTRLADSLQLEMAIAGSPGWSETGGPWVKPEDGMKKLVWRETLVEGGKAVNASFAAPASTTGVFQNIPRKVQLGLEEATENPSSYYKDIAVIAYKLPVSDIPAGVSKPAITSSAGEFNLAQLTDGDVATSVILPSDTIKGSAWIQFAYTNPQTIKAVTLVGGGDKGPFGLSGEFKDTRSLEASDDGKDFKWIAYIPAGNVLQQTITIPATTAKFFRVTFKNPPTPFSFASMMGRGEAPKPPLGTDIAEVVLHTATRINRSEEKAAFSPAADLSAHPTPESADTISTTNVIDISDKLNSDGTLSWTPPAGYWNILRFGYSLIGITNHPASPEATGLEVDKLDPKAVKSYFENYLDQYKDATKGMMGSKGGLQFMVTDSWEAGSQNWTGNLMQEFKKRRGYNMLLWMPVLTGHIIRSSEASEQFLWDFRKTLSELVAEYHYDQLTTILQQRGMKRYTESHENGRAMIADGMDIKRKAAIPMAAMWTPSVINGGDQTSYKLDIRESASVAHIYGQNLVAAESLTAFGVGGNAWSYSPEKLKPTADLELASGLNRFVIHTSVHQPVDDKIPGLGLGPFGQWFNRHETWAEQATAWTSYLARSSYMLQQGKFVADIVYYYGEDNNITALFSKKMPGIPEGYNYDFVNADALLNLLAVKNKQIVTPSGMQYRILALDSNSRQMTLKILKKISALVKAGAVVVGPRPAGTPSLSDDKKEYDKIVNELWGGDNKGKVYAGLAIQKVLDSIQVAPDFVYTKKEPGAELLFVHRKLPTQEFYWINNRSNAVQNVEGNFRVSDRSVEIWHPETGKTEQASYSASDGGTLVPLHLEPNDAVFVVFKEGASKTGRTLPEFRETALSTIEGDWKLHFKKDLGAPDETILHTLDSWTTNTEPGIKYYSGTGTYLKTIDAPQDWFANGNRLWIDLGDVKDLAEIVVNGKSLGIAWKKPFRMDVSNALKPGSNTLEIRVTNLWVNRLIGDQQPGVTNKITYTTMPFYQANSPLLPSGLLGPVRILSVR